MEGGTPPTNMEKVIINFTFFLLNPFPKLQYALLDFGDFEWDQCCHFERFQYAKHPICCIARPPSRHHHWSSLLLSIPIIIGMAIYENGANQTKWSHLISHIRSYGPSEIHEGKMIDLGRSHHLGSCELDKYYLTEGSFSNKIGSRNSLEQPAVIKSYRFLQPPSATAAFEHHIFFPS